jgi:hypothetical protein
LLHDLAFVYPAVMEADACVGGSSESTVGDVMLAMLSGMVCWTGARAVLFVDTAVFH